MTFNGDKNTQEIFTVLKNFITIVSATSLLCLHLFIESKRILQHSHNTSKSRTCSPPRHSSTSLVQSAYHALRSYQSVESELYYIRLLWSNHGTCISESCTVHTKIGQSLIYIRVKTWIWRCFCMFKQGVSMPLFRKWKPPMNWNSWPTQV